MVVLNLFIVIIVFVLIYKLYNLYKYYKLYTKAKQFSPKIIIIGAGFSGISLAVHLKKLGISFEIIDSEETPGGTWKKNKYPGCACDVPSHLYDFSFEPNAYWSEKWSSSDEIESYINYVFHKYGLFSHFINNTKIESATWQETSQQWLLSGRNVKTLKNSTKVCDIVVYGLGQLNHPSYPKINGLKANIDGTCSSKIFKNGRILHTARWNQDYDATNRNIVVVGTGASAIQLIPELAKTAKQLTVIQSSTSYIVDRDNYKYHGYIKWLFANVPMIRRLYRFYLYFYYERFWIVLKTIKDPWYFKPLLDFHIKEMEDMVGDDDLFEIVKPKEPIGCKRVLTSRVYFEALKRENVNIITGRITELTNDGIMVRKHDGTVKQCKCDDIIFATGFKTQKFCMLEDDIVGRNGQNLSEQWGLSPYAYYGMTVPNFPNMFIMYGPNTNLGHNSIIYMIECQTNYIVQMIEHMILNHYKTCEVQADETKKQLNSVQDILKTTKWSQCNNWYRNIDGQFPNNWCGFTFTYWYETWKPKFTAFNFRS